MPRKRRISSSETRPVSGATISAADGWVALSVMRADISERVRLLMLEDAALPPKSMATITGTDGNNTLRGASADDTLYGLAGNDSLTGSGGADALYGGTGNDTLNMDAADTVIDGGD